MFVSIISFILVLSVLVLVHELGHFLTAKFFGVKVEEFGFGFPPRAIGKKIGETIYSLNWLPIGGFVKLYGEDEAGGGKLPTSTHNSSPITHNLDRAFYARPVWQRATMVFAGVFMNFLLAAFVMSYVAAVQGLPAAGNDVVVAGVAPHSPAATAGLKEGDKLVAIDDQKVTSADQVISYTKEHLGKKITLQIITHNSSLITVQVTPRIHAPANEGAMGVVLGFNIVYKKYPWYQAPLAGLKDAWDKTVMIAMGLVQVVQQAVVQRQIPQGLAGPVGIAQLTGQFVQEGFTAVLTLLAVLSLNLAILNVLPIPALDGGRLFFILWEGFTGKKVSSQVEGYIHAAGMIALFALIAFITYHDIARLLSGQSLIPR